MDFYQILLQSVYSLVFVTICGVILKVLFGRLFKSIDNEIKAISRRVDDLSESFKDTCKELVHQTTFDLKMKVLDDVEDTVEELGKDVVRLQEGSKSVTEIKDSLKTIDSLRAEFLDKFQRKPEFNREMQIFASQLESIFKKIDHLDEKLDQIRDRKRNGS